MTKSQILRIATVWQKRLKLDHVNIEYIFEEPKNENAEASCWHASHYAYAKIWFSPEKMKEWDRKDANIFVVHELVHVQLHELDECVDDTILKLHSSDQYAYRERYHHEQEGAVDGIAHRYVELGGIC